MTINTKELQQFYNVWGPMITSLPAIINAAEHEAELQTSVARLQTQAQAAIAKSDKVVADQAKGLEVINAQMQALAAKSHEASQAANAHEKACAARVLTATKQADVDVAAQAARTEEVRADTATVAAALQGRMAEAEDTYNTHAAKLQQQTDALEAKRALAEKALAALRTTLG